MGTTGLRNAAIFTFVVSMAILLAGGLFRQGQGAAHSREGRERGPGDDQRGGDPARPGRLPALRTDGPRERLGTRLAARHGLLGLHAALRRRPGQAASSRRRAKPSADAYQELPPQPRRDLDEADATVIRELRQNRYDENSQDSGTDAGPGLRLRADAEVLGQGVLRGRRALRLPQEHGSHGRRAAGPGRFLLLDGLGGGHEPARA